MTKSGIKVLTCQWGDKPKTAMPQIALLPCQLWQCIDIRCQNRKRQNSIFFSNVWNFATMTPISLLAHALRM